MLKKDEWLSRYFKGGAYNYNQTDLMTFPGIKQGFVYSKIPTDNKIQLNTLINEGFKLVEILITYEQTSAIQHCGSPEVEVGFVRKTEKDDIVNIAKDAFLFSRLYQDSRIPTSVASQIKADWVANFFMGLRGDNLIVVRKDKQIAGFMLLVNKTTIDLIAVSPNYFRKGMGSTMIGFANQNLGLLNAGTQLNNGPSIAMYEKCGFIMKKSYYVLHNFYGQL